MNLVKVNNCQMLYLDNKFNIDINKNELHLITGANGSGKSTLIKLILGLIKPDIGNIVKKNIKIGYAPELFELPKYVKTKSYLLAISELKNDCFYMKYVEDLNVPINKTLSALSKGNLQKVNIISAFMGLPDLIILDEPFSGLDEFSQRKILKIIKSKLEQCSFVISTHKPNVFKKLATKIYEF